MTKLKVRGLKWKRLKIRGSVLHFCLKFIKDWNFGTSKLYSFITQTPMANLQTCKAIDYFMVSLTMKPVVWNIVPNTLFLL